MAGSSSNPGCARARLGRMPWPGPPDRFDGSVPVYDSLWINGRATSASDGATLETVDPATGEVVARFALGTARDVDRAVRTARTALSGPWGAMTPETRGRRLLDLAAACRVHAEPLAELETLDTGKPMAASRGDVAGVAATLTYNAGAADKLEGTTVPLGRGFVDFTEAEPLGVTAHITPWNFPLGMAVRSLAPALAAGCTAVIKPAEQTPFTTLALARLAESTGFPPGVINVVTGDGPGTGAAVAGHPGVNGVTFTGSVETGRRVGAAAGQNLRPVVLELGGKNPLIVFADADLRAAVTTALDGAFDNSGQVCSSVSRLLLDEDIAEAFLSRFVEEAGRLRVGPAHEEPDLGPLISHEQYDRVRTHLDSAAGGDAQFLLGEPLPAWIAGGYFVKPVVLEPASLDSPVACEETFGPVVTVFRFSGENEAVRIANRLPYGLAAGIYTARIDRALGLARRLDVGTVWINGWFIGGVQAPTGGTKDSGFGRERGLEGIRSYLRIKNVGIEIGPADSAASGS
ncbi:MAG: aldehyde dehydrogenase family protein [Paracoccaceae bacterium]|nr:aldehyde dehydrogenase family protein [Paracoccaceae bacterium]MDE2913140.1 aldehyde dehydrogenase family protein [Paracoccaceae bacterium]